MELSVQVNKPMYVLTCNGVIYGVDVVCESKSGDTIKTSMGEIMRTHTKNHRIFNSLRIAEFAADEANNNT